MIDITVAQIVNDAIVLAGGIGATFGLGKSKKAKSFLGWVKAEEPKIVAGVEDVLKSPAGKAVEAKLHVEMDHLHDELKKSSIAQYALAAIHGARKLYDEMSPSVQASAIAFVKAHLPKSVVATEKEIVDVLKSSPDIVKAFEDDATFKKAQEFTQLLSSANAPSEPEQQA